MKFEDLGVWKRSARLSADIYKELKILNDYDKFPDGYVMELNKDEWDSLKSKLSTSKKGGTVKLPKAFTERGLYMLATILKSKQAVQTTLLYDIKYLLNASEVDGRL